MSGGLIDKVRNVLFRQSGDAVTGYGNVVAWERREGEDDEYDVVQFAQEVEAGTVRTADGLQVTGPCLICGYVVHVVTAAGTIEVEDGVTAGTGTDRFVIPSGTAVGVYHFGGLGIKCTTGAFLNYVGATGSVSLLVRLAAGSTLAA